MDKGARGYNELNEIEIRRFKRFFGDKFDEIHGFNRKPFFNGLENY